MFRRKPRSKNSFLILHSSNRGSDIVKPENTSLIVNESDSDTENLHKELTSIFSEDEECDIDRKSSSFMKSLSQKTQSTPLNQSPIHGQVQKNRKNSQCLTQKTKKSKNVQNNTPLRTEQKCYFEEVLKANGASPLDGNSSFLLCEDQAVFSIKVNSKLEEDPENKKKFITSLRDKIKENGYLEKLLAHTLTAENCEVARGPVQEPMLRLLLNVNCLKKDLIELLLTVVGDFVTDNKIGSESAQIVSSVLHQMRFLNGTHDIKISSKLFELILVASINIKREIIFLLPEIISEEETEETCLQLLDLLKFDEALTNAIIDSVAHLRLSQSLRSKVCAKVLNRLDKCPLEFMPSLVQFVLLKCCSDEIDDVINGLRKALPFTPQHHQMKEANSRIKKSDPEEDSYVKLTFENLKFSIMASKQMTEVWIKLISSLNSSKDFRCVDLAMLIIFYSCLHGRKSQVLQLIRNKIKLGVLTDTLIQNLFKILKAITQEYCSSILEIASALLKSPELKISNFGSLLYKECFTYFHFHMRQLVISEILLHIGTGTPTSVNAALHTLKELCIHQKQALSQHTTTVMGLLVKVSDLELTQVRILMDIITDVVFFGSSDSKTAYDELIIFIRKQLISSKLEQCKKGVSAAVMFGKHSGKEEHFKDDNQHDTNSLLELAMRSDGRSESKRGFFNDEFASMVKEAQLSESFLEIWSERTFSYVKSCLFDKSIDTESANFVTSSQLGLNSEGVEKLVLPVVGFVVKANSKTPSTELSLPLLPSTFRLLWCLERNLKRALPVYLASVVMPDSSVYDGFGRLDDIQQKMILDSLFLCGNYLIECVNALCSNEMLDQAVLRFKQLISVRKLIAKNVDKVPGYVPQLCQFHSFNQKVIIKKKVSEKKTKKGRKRKFEETASETIKSFVETQQQSPETSVICSRNEMLQIEQPPQETDLSAYSDFFRELDFNAHKLLMVDSNFSFDLDGSELEASEVLFLLEDLLRKAEKVLKLPEVSLNFKIKPTSLQIQKMTPESFIKASITILPSLLTKIESFSNQCQNLLKSTDWNYESQELYMQDVPYVKLAMSTGLSFISEIISWRGFPNSYPELFKDLLSTFKGGKKSNRNGLESNATTAMDAANYLAGFNKTILVLSGALSIVKSFKSCLSQSDSKPCTALADLCYEFLCRKWFTPTGVLEQGSVYNQHVDYLLKIYFTHSDDNLEVVRTTAKMAFDELKGLERKDSVMTTLKTINKKNFPLLYRTLCEALVTSSSDEFSKTSGNCEKQLEIWTKIVETLLVLVEISKIHPSRVILAALLKRSQSMIQLFLSKGIPLVESALRVKSIEVLTLLKSFQMVTRFLHSICCHSRITNDSLVATHVPTIRSQCERLTLEVKAMLILNGIPTDCITIAVLKNRDIKGNDIISQETMEDNSDDESEELPPEDTPDDVESDKDLIEEEEKKESDSEIY